MFAMLAPLFAGSVASAGIMSAATAKIALTAGGALIDTAIAKNKAKSANAAQQAAYEKQLAQDEKNRALAKEDASNKFSDMSAAARKAGFNPLTVLRATGGAGFGSYGGYSAIAPVLSKFNFAQTFAQKAAKSFYDQKINEPIDKYNKEIRDLELQQRKIDLKLGQQALRVGSGLLAGGRRGGGMPEKGNNPMSTDRTSVETPFGKTSPSGWSDAEVFQTRYGDLIEEAAGATILTADLVKNAAEAIERSVLPPLAKNNVTVGGYRVLGERIKQREANTYRPTEYPKMGQQWSMYAP